MRYSVFQCISRPVLYMPMLLYTRLMNHDAIAVWHWVCPQRRRGAFRAQQQALVFLFPFLFSSTSRRRRPSPSLESTPLPAARGGTAAAPDACVKRPSSGILIPPRAMASVRASAKTHDRRTRVAPPRPSVWPPMVLSAPESTQKQRPRVPWTTPISSSRNCLQGL